MLRNRPFVAFLIVSTYMIYPSGCAAANIAADALGASGGLQRPNLASVIAGGRQRLASVNGG